MSIGDGGLPELTFTAVYKEKRHEFWDNTKYKTNGRKHDSYFQLCIINNQCGLYYVTNICIGRTIHLLFKTIT